MSVEIRANGETVSAQRGTDGSYYIEIENVAAKDLGQVFIYEIGGYKFSYGAMSYAYSVLSTPETEENLINTAKHLYNYYKEAEKYFK